MRADAVQNRQRVLDAAAAMFREHGIDVGVGEIADAAGVGRGTLFRNFATKEHLIAAVVSELIQEAIAEGRELLNTTGDDTELVFTFIADIVGRQQADRALLEGVSEDLHIYPEMRAAHADLIEVMTALLERAQRAGAVRPEVMAMDVMTLVKGICMNPTAMDGSSPEAVIRHLDLIRAAVTTPAYARPLRGAPPAVPGLTAA